MSSRIIGETFEEVRRMLSEEKRRTSKLPYVISVEEYHEDSQKVIDYFSNILNSLSYPELEEVYVKTKNDPHIFQWFKDEVKFQLMHRGVKLGD